MAHTLAAVFDNRPDAERAREALTSAGYDRDCVRLEDANSRIADASASSGTSDDLHPDAVGGFMDSVRHFFSDLFGNDTDEHQLYSEAVKRGNTVLIVKTRTADEAERAADIVETCGPIDIDEQETQWRSDGWTGAPVGRVAMHETVVLQTGRGSAQSSPSSAQSSQSSAQSSQASAQSGGAGSQQYMAGAGSAERHDIRPATEADLAAAKRSGVRMFAQRDTDSPLADSWRGTQVDDAAFRSHWHSNFASSGSTYDEYEPAYRYGYSKASDTSNRGRSWDEVEPTLRSDWESRNPGSAWENFKAAVRHGWDRLTS